MDSKEPCPCDSGGPFGSCCGPILSGLKPAPTALALMRSRYCAYVTQDADYLLKSWHPDTRPAQISFDPQQRWLGLKIKATQAGERDDQTGVVEFVARYKIAGAGHRIHERSRFVRIGDHWHYLDGDQRQRSRNL
jgi:SEC-C motif domain protein